MRIFKDPHLITAPISTARHYAWAALTADWKKSGLILLLLILLSFASAIPLLGLFASFFQAVFLYALAYWIVEALRESESVEALRQKVTLTDLKAMLTDHFAPAAGYYAGIMVLSLLFMAFGALVLWATGGLEMFEESVIQMQHGGQMTDQQATVLYGQMVAAGSTTFVIVAVASLFVSYVWPLSYGFALTQKGFGDAFRAAFTLFSPRFWKATFNGAYFRHVSIWMLVMLLAGFLLGVSMALIVLLPVGLAILLWMVYFTAVAAAESYNFTETI